MMTSDGHVHMMEIILEGVRHTGFSTRDPMPDSCDPRKVLSALDRLADRPLPIPRSDATLLPLTPFEAGYVLGVLAEYRTWRENHR